MVRGDSVTIGVKECRCAFTVECDRSKWRQRHRRQACTSSWQCWQHLYDGWQERTRCCRIVLLSPFLCYRFCNFYPFFTTRARYISVLSSESHCEGFDSFPSGGGRLKTTKVKWVIFASSHNCFFTLLVGKRKEKSTEVITKRFLLGTWSKLVVVWEKDG